MPNRNSLRFGAGRCVCGTRLFELSKGRRTTVTGYSANARPTSLSNHVLRPKSWTEKSRATVRVQRRISTTGFLGTPIQVIAIVATVISTPQGDTQLPITTGTEKKKH